jgi:hypothetical protein
MGGCATAQRVGTALVPNTLAPEFEHISHASQHFGSNTTTYGANLASLVAHWDVSKRVYIELGEGFSLDKKYADGTACGEITGPREQFTGRIGYRFTLKE